MHVVEGFRIREVLDEIIAVPVGEVSNIFSGIISLNAVGRFLFEQLTSDQTEDSLVAALCKEYEVEPAVAAADVKEFLEHLRSAGLLVEE